MLYLHAADERVTFPQAFAGVYNLYTGVISRPAASSQVSPPVGVEPVVERRVGHRRMVLLANRALLEKAAGARDDRRE